MSSKRMSLVSACAVVSALVAGVLGLHLGQCSFARGWRGMDSGSSLQTTMSRIEALELASGLDWGDVSKAVRVSIPPELEPVCGGAMPFIPKSKSVDTHVPGFLPSNAR
jgi:hypothetical protein